MATVEQFLQYLTESGLFSAEDLRALGDRLASMDSSDDAKQLKDELIESNQLTPYQAEAIYQGHPHRLIIGRNYIVEDLIGTGGMGMVFRSRHRRMRRTVALKVLTSQTMNDEDAIRRFYQEVEVAATLDHRNIVRAFDADESGGIHYLVMEFVQGNDLQHIVEREGPLEVGQAVNCILQAAEGLAHAHNQRVIHRDIKPANLLLNHEGLVKILDMGLARINNPLSGPDSNRPGLTLPGSIMGTVDFMGPEQAADTTKADVRSDIYSLGCTLFFILMGRPVYEGSTAMVKLIAHRESPIPSLCELRDDVSPELDAVFQKMVAKAPDDRYQNMKSVIEALKPCRTESEEQTRETVSQFLSPALRTGILEGIYNTKTGKQSDTNIQKGKQSASAVPMPPSELDNGDSPRSDDGLPNSSQSEIETKAAEKEPTEDAPPAHRPSPETVDVTSPVKASSQPWLEEAFDEPAEIEQAEIENRQESAEPSRDFRDSDSSQTGSKSSTLTRHTHTDWGQTILLLAATFAAVGSGLAMFLLPTEEMLLTLFALAGFMVLVLLFRPQSRPAVVTDASLSGHRAGPSVSSSSGQPRPDIPDMQDPEADESEKTLDAKRLFEERDIKELRESFDVDGDEAPSRSVRRGSYAEVTRSRNTSQSITRRRLSESRPSEIPRGLKVPFDQAKAAKRRKQWARFLGIPAEMVNSVGLRMLLIPAGEFLMGSPEDEEGHLADEKQHAVRLTSPFFLATHPVTVGQFWKFVNETGYRTEAEHHPQGGYGFNGDTGKMEQSPDYSWRDPGFDQTDTHPVVNITWNDAVAFCQWVSRRERITYRLPTEAEWEFACRAGTNSRYFSGDDPESLVDFGNVADASTKVKFPQLPTISSYGGYIFTAPVESFRPNAFGLYDMHGNVWEWCADVYGKTYYQESPPADPTGPAEGQNRVLRGGSWMNAPLLTRSAKRLNQRANQFFIANGFRLAATP